MFFNYLKKKIRTITEDKSVFYQSGGGEGGGGGGGGGLWSSKTTCAKCQNKGHFWLTIPKIYRACNWCGMSLLREFNMSMASMFSQSVEISLKL